MSDTLRSFVLRNDTNAQSLWAFLKGWRALADAGKPLSVTVQEYKSKRSVEQNKRYWSILRDISANAWANGQQFSQEAWHEIFRRWFIGMEELPDGSVCGISTTTLDVAAFADYMTRVEQYAVEELGVEILA